MAAETIIEPAPAWALCADCNSTGEVHITPGVGVYVFVTHSDTCPAWGSSDPEIALSILTTSPTTTREKP